MIGRTIMENNGCHNTIICENKVEGSGGGWYGNMMNCGVCLWMLLVVVAAQLPVHHFSGTLPVGEVDLYKTFSPPLNPSSCLFFFSYSIPDVNVALPRPFISDYLLSASLSSNGTTLRLSRATSSASSPALTVRVSVVDLTWLPSIFVRPRVHHACYSLNNLFVAQNFPLPFGAVDGRRAVFASHQTGEANTGVSSGMFFASEFNGTEDVFVSRLDEGTAPVPAEMCFQALAWDGGTATSLFANTSFNVDPSVLLPVPNFNTDHTLFSFRYTIGFTGTTVANALFTSTMPNSMALEVSRGSVIGVTNTDEIRVRADLIDFGSNSMVRTYRLDETLSIGVPDRVVQIPGLDPKFAFVVPGGWGTFGRRVDDGADLESMAASFILTPGMVTIFRASTAATCRVMAVVVDLSAALLNSTVVIPAGSVASSASYAGNLVLDASSTLATQAGVTTTVAGALVIRAGASLVIRGVTGSGSNSNRATSTLVVASAGSITGTFSSVTAVPADSCQTASVSMSSYTATSLSVTVNVAGNPCSGGLSQGAIIGIAVGASVGGLLLAAAIVILFVFWRRRQTASANQEIRMKELQH